MSKLGRKTKFPGLQEKFESTLQEKKKSGDKFKTDEILKLFSDLTREERSNFKITDDEIGDIKQNSANYIKRAKDKGVLRGLGTRQGYELIDEDEAEAVSSDEKPLTQNERILHAIVTPVLSKEYNSLVMSLPSHVSKKKWANPDCLMIRDSWYADYREENDIDNAYIRKIDSTPDYIISSIEIKYNLIRRKEILDALSQTAINGSWAHENWLVFMNKDHKSPELDNDTLNFAKNNGIGIIQILFKSENIDEKNKDEIKTPDIKNYSISSRKHNIDLGDFSTSSSKQPLTKYLNELIKQKDEDGSFFDQENNYEMLGELLFQIHTNLKMQHSKKDKFKIKNCSKNIDEYLNEALKSIYNYLPFIIEDDNKITANSFKNKIGDTSFASNKSNVARNVIEWLEKI